MRNLYSFALIAIMLVGSGQLTHAQAVQGDKKYVQMGVSQVNITPAVPILMSGYEARKTPFTGVHDSLFASALYFKNEKTSVLLITADLIGYSRSFVNETRKMISGKIGIPVENIMITAVHNHGGPVTRAYENVVPDAINQYMKGLQEKFINMSVHASENMVPFRMGTGKGVCNMNINRRAEFADGGVWLGRDPDKPCDHELDVVKFEDLNNKTLAVLINWPCHATTNGQDNYLITADWPGAAARYIKKQTGNQTVVAVTAGASGDINPLYGPGKDFNEIEAVGYHVGVNAWKTFNDIVTYPVESIAAEQSSLKLPGKKQCKDQFPQKTYEPGPDVTIDFTTFKIGKLILAGISGELMNEMGMAIKKQSPYTDTMIITHCNGSSGYICTDKAFSEGGYEVKVTQLMPGAEKPLTEKVIKMIHAL